MRDKTVDFSKMMKEAQRIQKELAVAQKKIEELEIEGLSAGGMVSLWMSGKGRLLKLHIDDSLMEDREMLEDLIVAAYHDAYEKLEAEKNAKMSGLQLPSGMGF